MVLEATMICIDNSEHMRNGDFVPSRFDAQHDAVNLITGAKTNQNQQSSVGVLAMATGPSKSVEILVNPTNDESIILTSMHKASVGGTVNLSSGLNVARLALKHRENRNQHQRIIAFVGSPLNEELKDLVKLGKKLKKNNVSVDVVNFGEEASNTEKLEAFISAVNRDDTSHLVTVPPGPHYLSDILVSSAILRHDDGGDTGVPAAAGGAGDVGGGGFDFGGDASMDYELQMALRMSAEEHEREQARNAASGGDSAGDDTAAAGGEAGGDAAPAAATTMEMDEDEEMRLAIEMSLAEAKESEGQAAAPEAGDAATGDGNLSDANYVSSVLMSLPGLDSSNPEVQGAVAAAADTETKDVDMKEEGEGDAKKDDAKDQ